VSVGKLHPASREAAVAAVTRLLENFAEPGREPALNGFLVSDLVQLDAVEAVPLMQRAFAAGVVEEDVIGDWQAVQVELGLKDERDAARRDTPRYAPSGRPAPARPLPAQSRPQPATAPAPKRHRHRHKK